MLGWLSVEQAQAGMTIARYVVTIPATDDLGEVLAAGDGAMDKVAKLYYRCMGVLARAAEKVEAALGLSPIAPKSPDRQGEPDAPLRPGGPDSPQGG